MQNKAIEVKAPDDFDIKKGYKSVFLGGSIEEGKAEDWQSKIVKALKDEKILFLNPRRDDWDASWEEKITNPEFKLQVTWELTSLEFADIIVMYFDPETKSPISLLELGLHSRSDKMIVCCPEPFYRKGNVDIVCEKYKIKQADSIEDVIKTIKKML